MANYYDQDFEPWVRGLRSIAGMMAQAPAMRAQAAMRQSQAEENQARLGLLTEQARGARLKADAGDFKLRQQQTLVEALLRHTRGAANPDGTVSITFDPNSFGEILAAGAGASDDGAEAALATERFTKTANAPAEANRGRVATAARSAATDTNRLTIAERLNASREKMARERGQVLGPGAAVVNQDGSIRVRNPSAASEREGEYETITEEIPGTPAIPGEPAVPPTFGWFGRVIDPGKPATQDTPAIPTKKTTTRRKLGGDETKAKPTPTRNTPKPGQVSMGGLSLGTVEGAPAIPTSAIEYLKANPNLAAFFDEKYGAGAARRILGK